MKPTLLLIAISLLAHLCAGAQTFEQADYRSLDTYDSWEASPLRDGRLRGHVAVASNPRVDTVNPSAHVLAFQRSRYASNLYGARIGLCEPIALTPRERYVHALVWKPKAGRVMLIALGKRTERTAQNPATEQLCELSLTPVVSGHWCDAVFPVKGAAGSTILDLVIVPDCESPHNLQADFAAYIDDIVVTDSPEPRTLPTVSTADTAAVASTLCRVTGLGRNGLITATDGSALSGQQVTAREAFTVRAVPAAGFTAEAIIVRSGQQTLRLTAADITPEGHCTIKAEMMTGDVEIEGIFAERK